MAPTGRASAATDEATQSVRFIAESPPLLILIIGNLLAEKSRARPGNGRPGPRKARLWASAFLALEAGAAALVNLAILEAMCPLSRGQIDHAHRADRLLQAAEVNRAAGGHSPGPSGPNRQSQHGNGRGNPKRALHGQFTSFMGTCKALAGKLDCTSCRSEERRVGKECRSRWSPYH